MALYLCQNFVFVQYLQNQLVEFHQILYMHSSWQYLAWNCYTSFFANLHQSYGPWFMSKFCFCSISRELTDIFSPNFLYAFILTKSSFGLLHIFFLHIFTWVTALDLRQNFISVQYLENKLTEFHQILYMHLYWQDLRWDCYTSFFAHLYQHYGPWFTPKICFPLNILRTNGQIFIQLYITIYTDKIYIGIVSCHFSQICKRVMDLDWCQNYFNTHSCIEIYLYSCLHPLSNERKSMFKSGDSRAVWRWVWTWKYLKWALH